MSSKQQLCNKASTVKDFALCERLQGEMRSLFKEKESLESQLKILQTKARKSNWYEKKRKSSLPPPENSTPASVDIRTLFTNMQKSAESTSSEIQAQDSIEPLNLQNDDDVVEVPITILSNEGDQDVLIVSSSDKERPINETREGTLSSTTSCIKEYDTDRTY